MINIKETKKKILNPSGCFKSRAIFLFFIELISNLNSPYLFIYLLIFFIYFLNPFKEFKPLIRLK